MLNMVGVAFEVEEELTFVFTFAVGGVANCLGGTVLDSAAFVSADSEFCLWL